MEPLNILILKLSPVPFFVTPSVHGISHTRILEWDAIACSQSNNAPLDWVAVKAAEWGGQDSHHNLCDPKPMPLTLHQTASCKTTVDTESLSVKDGEKQK